MENSVILNYANLSGISSPFCFTAAKKLGVRLRARQVLCNNCKNSCTETGETVQPKRSSEKENHQERSDVERRTRGKTPQSGPSTSLEQQPGKNYTQGFQSTTRLTLHVLLAT